MRRRPTSTCHSSIVPSVTDSPAAGVTMSMTSPACVAAVGPPSAGAVCVSSADAESTGAPPLESAAVGAPVAVGLDLGEHARRPATVSPSATWIFTTVPEPAREPRRRPCRSRSRRASRRPRRVALGLVPLQDRALGDRFAHRGHRDLDCRVDRHRLVALTLARMAGSACRSACSRSVALAPLADELGRYRRTVRCRRGRRPRPPRRIETTRGAQRRQDQQHHADPAEPVGQAEDHLAPAQAGHEPDDQQARVDRRVGEREPLQRGNDRLRGGGSARRSCRRASAAIRRSTSSASSGHSVDVGAATRRARRARGRASTSAPDGSQACPTNITIRWGSSTSASTWHALGRDRPLLVAARAPACRPGSRDRRPRRRRRAPSARPTTPATPRAGPRASGRRRRAPRTAQRPSGWRRPRRGAAPSAPAAARARARRRSPCWWPTSRAATPSWLGEPRSASAATAASAAPSSAARLERLLAPARRHPVRRPGAAGEDAGRVAHQADVRRRRAIGRAVTGLTGARRAPALPRRILPAAYDARGSGWP